MNNPKTKQQAGLYAIEKHPVSGKASLTEVIEFLQAQHRQAFDRVSEFLASVERECRPVLTDESEATPGDKVLAERCILAAAQVRVFLSTEKLDGKQQIAAALEVSGVLADEWHSFNVNRALHKPVTRDQKRQAGTQKKRRADVDEWIYERLIRNPVEKSPEMWQAAPDWLTEQIGEDRFKKRVTEQRKKVASK